MRLKRANFVFIRSISVLFLMPISMLAFSQNVHITEKGDSSILQSDNKKTIGKSPELNRKETSYKIKDYDKTNVTEASSISIPMIDDSYIYKPLSTPSISDKNVFQDARLSVITIPSFKYAPYATWKGGYIGTAGYIQSMRGMMDMATGAVFLNQNLGALNLSAYGIANKYALPFYKYYTNQFGVGGTASLNLGENVSLNAFGTYYATMPVMPATASSYVGSTNFGGFMDLGFSKKVGVDLGARHYFNTFTGHWITDPIVRPYFKLNGKDKLGIDFGGLLKSFIWGKDHYEGEGPMPMKARPMKMMKAGR